MTDILQQFDHQHLWHPYASLPPSYPNLLIERAKGVYLYTQNGERLIDGMSSWWAAIHGYNHPVLNQAIYEQLDKMAHVMFGGLTHQPAITLGKTLIDITPEALDACFFSDSGSVAVEVALKMALQYQIGKQQPQKNQFATTHSGYHGDTWHAMSVCDPITGMHSLYGRQLPMQHFIDAPPMGFDRPFNEQDTQPLKQLFTQYGDRLAGFIIEPIIQGAGGMRFYSPEYLCTLQELCQQYDVLLIADEIATGFGRSGKLFACEHANICPDIMTLGKALTAGYMSFACTLCTRMVADTIYQSPYPTLMHGPTFMANPLACHVAQTAIELTLQIDAPAIAQAMQHKFANHLAIAKDWHIVKDVRCLGAVAVIELTQKIDMAKFQSLLIQYGIWIRPFGKLLYLMPPYIITDEQLHILCHKTLSLLREYFNKI